jgi:hypothetical protein
MTDEKRAADDAERQFTEWFAENYPGPDTIIYDPLWHAPKILRAAQAALSARADQPEPAKDAVYGGKGEALTRWQKAQMAFGGGPAPQAECAPREAIDARPGFDQFFEQHVDGQDTIDREWLRNFVNKWEAR